MPSPEGVAGREHPSLTKTLRRIHKDAQVRVWEVEGKLYYQGTWKVGEVPVTVNLGVGYAAALRTTNWLVKSEMKRRQESGLGGGWEKFGFKKKEEGEER